MSLDRGQLLGALKQHRLIAIVRGTSGEAADRTADALLEGGVRMIEVTLNTPGALGAIERWRGRFADRMLVGAGTVLDEESARAAIGAGAQYLISPSLNEDVIALGIRHGVSVWPGVISANEILRARAIGADAVKIFPANVVGSKYFSDLRAPIGDFPMIAVGGVAEKNIREFLDAGAVGVGLGGSLVDANLIRAGKFDELRELARRVTTIAAEGKPQ